MGMSHRRWHMSHTAAPKRDGLITIAKLHDCMYRSAQAVCLPEDRRQPEGFYDGRGGNRHWENSTCQDKDSDAHPTRWGAASWAVLVRAPHT
jgi:hypothetical protein